MIKENGMTLIEVLVAAIIMFTVFALASQVYSVLLLRNSKSKNVAELYEMQDVLNELIVEEVQKGKTKGVFTLRNNNVTWIAKVIDSKPEVGSYNELTSTLTNGANYLFLYEIEVKFDRININNYKFVRLVWKDKKE